VSIERFEDLMVWQEARTLSQLVYQATKQHTFSDDRDLVRQMRRAAISVMSNIAEGFSRYSVKDSKHFFVVARGSLAELRSQLYVARDQRYLVGQDAQEIQGQIETTGKLLSGLIRSARKRLQAGISDELSETREPFNH